MSLKSVTCPTCFIEYAIPNEMYERARELKNSQKVHCPNGHSWWYVGETEADKQRRRAELAEQHNAQLYEEARAAIKKRNETVAELQRHRRRTVAGVCPCCKRSFLNMQRHIKTKHPDYNVVPLKAKSRT